MDYSKWPHKFTNLQENIYEKAGVKLQFSYERKKIYLCCEYKIHPDYSEILLLRPPKIQTNSPLKSIFKKFQSFFLCVFSTQCLLEGDHLWDCSKVVFKTTFEQSQRWSYYRNFTVHVRQAKLLVRMITLSSPGWAHTRLVLLEIRAQGYKTFFMLNSAENEICSVYKKLNTVNLNFLPAQQNWAWNFSC